MIGFYAAGAMGVGGDAPAVPLPFFASDLMLSTAWGQVTYPAAIYVASMNSTIVCWQFVGLSGYKGVHVAAYDHSDGAWSPRYTVGNFLLANDDHGDAVLLRDADGYIHCWFGSHGNGQQYSVTNSPDDISAWTQQADIGTTLTYPKPVLVGSTIYLFAREQAINTNRKLTLTSTTPSSGIGVWSGFQDVVDFGSNSRVYTAEAHVVGTEIHFVCSRSNFSDSERKGVYYFIYETTTGNVKNYNGTTTVTSASLPVNLTTSNASFRVFDHGSGDGDLGSFQFDTSGNAHIIFADGVAPSYDLKHITLSGGTWSSPATIDSIPDQQTSVGFVGNYTLVQAPSGAMEAWYNNSDGDKKRSIRPAGGPWGAPVVVLEAGALPLYQSNAVKDAAAQLRTVFAENSGTTTDSGAAKLKLYAYGDSGPVNAAIDMMPEDPHWDDVVLLLGCNHRNGVSKLIDDSQSCFQMTANGSPGIDSSVNILPGKPSLKLSIGDYYTLPVNPAFDTSGTNSFSFTVRVRLNETGRIQTFIGNSSGTQGGFFFGVIGTNVLRFIMWNGSTERLGLVGTTAMTTGVDYYVEVSKFGDTAYMFLDGALEASGAQTGAPAAGGSPTTIGRWPTRTDRDFNGWLVEPRFTRAARNTSSYAPPAGPAPRR